MSAAPMSKVQRLQVEADAAARTRALTTDPNVVALRVEKVRAQVDRLIWAGILLGLAFTMVNVQQFAAAGSERWSLPWLAAWLLDPMVSLVLIAVLRAEQVTARWQVPETGPWATRTKWFAFTATYVMNTWSSWAKVDAAGIVLHSVPPILVLAAAEAGPYLRDRLTEAVLIAARTATDTGKETAYERDAVTVPVNAPVGTPPAEPVNTPVNGPVNAPVNRPAPVRKAPAKRAKKGATKNTRRKFLGDYVNEARVAYGPGVNITPAWVREVTDCSRGLSTKVAATLRTELATSDDPIPFAEVREAA
jgi:hypothetical protein